ncbi:MAG TPA: UDP-4-amino-4,6-dideoxy-N-acetyl-beta-L-altrosamine transaminase [Gemmataceae bacterium]|jgi:perosamine synthetase|nr:UDP-4-amino-4,6-dideoxy-N-acetyl-beta-L-altrosamine transaminase [Gemmataceae bacterium]
MLPYSRQSIDEDDIAAVVEVLRSDWLTTGPKVAEFERAFADFTGSREAVAVNSGTAALHAAMYALGIGRGDEILVPAMTFAATANCVVFQGGTPVFVDVDAGTLLIDPAEVEAKITPRTRAIVAVDYAGQPCPYKELAALAKRHGLALVADACHSLGGAYQERPVGALADLSAFSFHPVKPITTAEGGMITTDDAALAKRMRLFRNHGITTDHREREAQGAFSYEMIDLGYNYRLCDLQCALGISQLRKLPGWVSRRQEIARRYDRAFREMPEFKPLAQRPGVKHAYHLYVVRLDLKGLGKSRAEAFRSLRAAAIGVNVHYVPVHLHPFYRERFGTVPGLCPVAEAAYEQILSLPIFPRMLDRDVDQVLAALRQLVTPRAHKV